MCKRSIGTAFYGNTVIETFDELNLFTNVKTTSESAFYNCRNLKSVGLMNLTSAGHQLLRASGIIYAWMPKVIYAGSSASQAYRAWFYGCNSIIAVRFDVATSVRMIAYDSSVKYMIFTMSAVPTFVSPNYLASKLYVPESLVNAYQETLGTKATVYPISRVATDYPNCPWLDDLRQKGFIN